MAKTVPELPSVETAPWRQYADGETWEINTKRDLSPATTAAKARQAAYAWARRNGFRGEFRTDGDYTLFLKLTKLPEAGVDA